MFITSTVAVRLDSSCVGIHARLLTFYCNILVNFIESARPGSAETLTKTPPSRRNDLDFAEPIEEGTAPKGGILVIALNDLGNVIFHEN